MEGISRRGFLGWTAWTAVGLGTGAGRALDKAPAPQVANGAEGETSPPLRAIDAFVERHRRERGIPGITLGLADRERVISVRTYGHADIKTGRTLRPQDLFQIGSISKSFTAIALLQLREEGKLDLHRPVREYLPWLRIESSYAPITIHHLLSHTAGLPNPLSLPSTPLWTAHAPGENFHYCNAGYNILGMLLETIDRKPFRESIQSRIFTPLGMTSSEAVISHESRARMPVSYWPMYDDRPFQRHAPLVEAPYILMDNAAGSIASVPADMALYMRMLLNRGRSQRGALLSEESFNLFKKPVIPAPAFGKDASYGYGIGVQPVAHRTILRHTGGMVSFSSAMQVDLDAGFGAFASVNASLAGYRPNEVVTHALAVLRAAAAGDPLPEPPELEDPHRLPRAGAYAGVFTAPDGRKLVLVADGEQLKLDYRGEKIVLERLAPDIFFVSHPDFALFPLIFEREHMAVAQVSHGPDWYASESYQGPRTFDAPAEWQGYAGHYRNENPWEGSARVVLRKGRLWLTENPLVPLRGALFRFGEESHAPDRVLFDEIVNGKARRMLISGVEYRRVET